MVLTFLDTEFFRLDAKFLSAGAKEVYSHSTLSKTPKYPVPTTASGVRLFAKDVKQGMFLPPCIGDCVLQVERHTWRTLFVTHPDKSLACFNILSHCMPCTPTMNYRAGPQLKKTHVNVRGN